MTALVGFVRGVEREDEENVRRERRLTRPRVLRDRMNFWPFPQGYSHWCFLDSLPSVLSCSLQGSLNSQMGDASGGWGRLSPRRPGRSLHQVPQWSRSSPHNLPVCRSSKLHLEFPNHHSEILIWNFQITIQSIGTHFRMDSKWFQMQGLDLILETSKLFPNYFQVTSIIISK